jgi:hypothetical protein
MCLNLIYYYLITFSKCNVGIGEIESAILDAHAAISLAPANFKV